MKRKGKIPHKRALAEVQVLVDDIFRRDYYSLFLQFHPNIYPKAYLEGVVNEAEILESSYRRAKKAILKGNSIEANRYTSEFALAAKNLADNLNSYMQVLYADYREAPLNWKMKLSDLEKNTLSAPKTDDDRTLAQVFQGTHSFGGRSLVKVLRDKKGHGNGHLVLEPDERVPSGYKIKFGMNMVEEIKKVIDFGRVDAEEWLDSQVMAYLGMAKTCLGAISEKESERLVPRKKRKNVYVQMYKNWNDRNRKQVQIFLATWLFTAGVTGGVLGTLGWKEYQARTQAQSLANNAEYVLEVGANLRSYDRIERTVAEDLKKQILEKRAQEIKKYSQSTFVIRDPKENELEKGLK